MKLRGDKFRLIKFVTVFLFAPAGVSMAAKERLNALAFAQLMFSVKVSHRN